MDPKVVDLTEILVEDFFEAVEFAGLHVVAVLFVGILADMDFFAVCLECLDSAFGEFVVTLGKLWTFALC